MIKTNYLSGELIVFPERIGVTKGTATEIEQNVIEHIFLKDIISII
jgi:hypothetical protein